MQLKLEQFLRYTVNWYSAVMISEILRKLDIQYIATKAAVGSLFNYPNSLKFTSAGSDAPFYLSLPAMVLEAGQKIIVCETQFIAAILAKCMYLNKSAID